MEIAVQFGKHVPIRTVVGGPGLFNVFIGINVLTFQKFIKQGSGDIDRIVNINMTVELGEPPVHFGTAKAKLNCDVYMKWIK